MPSKHQTKRHARKGANVKKNKTIKKQHYRSQKKTNRGSTACDRINKFTKVYTPSMTMNEQKGGNMSPEKVDLPKVPEVDIYMPTRGGADGVRFKILAKISINNAAKYAAEYIEKEFHPMWFKPKIIFADVVAAEQKIIKVDNENIAINLKEFIGKMVEFLNSNYKIDDSPAYSLPNYSIFSDNVFFSYAP
jgi:hypothetical protein